MSIIAQPQRLQSSTPANLLTPGVTYHGFHCKNSQYYPEFSMSAYLLEHERLKTEYLHIHRNDNNNVFSVNLRTPIFDSTGLPHILEHLTLCGSQKYPVRDPFFKMLNRSLATFMNAMTGPDYTLYPFSTTNEVDYRNLQSIYLDAVFKPNLKYTDFLQEGWRLENTDLNNRNDDFMIKGVVFNEMKGVFASNDAILNYALINNLLPDHTYGHISGGDPMVIPDLSYENLVAFHRKHYHPSNARIFSYGNFDVQKTLQVVNDEYLNQFEKGEREFSKVPSQPRWVTPKTVDVTGRYVEIGAPIEKQSQIIIGYLTSDIADSYELLLLNVLSELLVRGPNSPFYKALIEPNIFGGSFSQVTGFESQLKDTIFSVGLENIQSKDFDSICQIFDQTVNQVVETGFDDAQVAGVLHLIELRIKHLTPKFGMNLLFGLTTAWNHDVDLFESLNSIKQLKRLQTNLEDKSYLQRKVKEYFLDNKHKLIVKMEPDQYFEQKSSQIEQELLAKKTSALSELDKEEIYKNAQQLAAEQKAPVSNAHLLPCLSAKDIPTTIEKYAIETHDENGTPTQVTLVDTNGVVYVQGICLGHHLSNDEQLLLPLLTDIFAQMGTKQHNYRELDTLITSKTSGISFNLHICENVANFNEYELGVSFGSYCLEKNTNDMFYLINELLSNFNLVDVQRFSVLLNNYNASLTTDIAQNGHSYAMRSSSGLLSECNQLKTQLSGFEHIAYMRKLCDKKKPEEILHQLQKLAEKLFFNGSKRYALNVDKANQGAVLQSFKQLTQHSNGVGAAKQQWLQSKAFNGESTILHNVVTFPVNYCSKAFHTVPYVHEDFARLRILGKILSAKYLLPVVREQNGAYGAGAGVDQSGVFVYFSYRDPNSRGTMNVFDDTYKWLQSNWDNIDDQALFESKLGVLQQMDAPIADGSKGLSQFKQGVTHELFAKQRERVLAVTRDDLRKIAEKYIASNTFYGKCLLGPDDNQSWTCGKNENYVKISGAC